MSEDQIDIFDFDEVDEEVVIEQQSDEDAASVEVETPAEVAEDPAPVKPARKAAKRAGRKKAAPVAGVAAIADEPPLMHRGRPIPDLRLTAEFGEDSVIVYNANPSPVVVNTRGQSASGYQRVLVSSDDPVAKRAIESGMLLVPSSQ